MKYSITIGLVILAICLMLYTPPPPRLSTVKLVELQGYPIESHYVTTMDGYILNLHRIPSGRGHRSNYKVALIVHGLLLSSEVWVFSGPKKGLGYILADEGYDVWMFNARGNIYSRNHTSFNADKDLHFWDFSWHEIGLYDLPASIDYILKHTKNDSLYYVGYSQGTTAMYVMNSLRPEYNSKIKVYTHLSPVAFMYHLASPLFRYGYLCPIVNFAELLPADSLIVKMLDYTCSQYATRSIICANILFLLSGYSPNEMDYTLLPYTIKQVTSGAATKQYMHYVQEIHSGKFQQFDYGEAGNLEKYGSVNPPDYDLKKVTAPGYLIHSSNDWIVDHNTDIPKLHNALGNCQGKYLVPVPSFGHLDFFMGISAPKFVYPSLIKFFSQH